MAVVVAFRIAIVLTPAAVRVVKWAEGPGVAQIPQALSDRLSDPSISDAQLEQEVSAATGRLSDVTTYSSPYSARRLHVRYQRKSGSALGDDVAMTTHDFLKLTAGAPNDTWVEGDFTAIEGLFDTFWAAIDNYYRPETVVDELRWYRIGPQDPPPQPPVRVVDKNLPGASSTSVYQLPPQCAISVTEKTSVRRSWGRFYLPSPSTMPLTLDTGRLDSSFQTAVADATDAWYTGAETAGIQPVVLSQGTTPAARSIDDIQVDDVIDVIRSRRWKQPLLRVQRAI